MNKLRLGVEQGRPVAHHVLAKSETGALRPGTLPEMSRKPLQTATEVLATIKPTEADLNAIISKGELLQELFERAKRDDILRSLPRLMARMAAVSF